MNNHHRNYFTDLFPCSRCGREPMRVYCNAADRYAAKCVCGNRTAGFTTIAGASHSWNHMNKNEPSPVCKTEDGKGKEYIDILARKRGLSSVRV
ncbi:hypothetical protein [Oscillibacter sp.]|uniref:hypothetical protein n=1 Tax=Oscillibacter sp. TaxID=1945593 RepID=UPI002898E574|nr:hypothetical protein [Oscillibacter sp.]